MKYVVDIQESIASRNGRLDKIPELLSVLPYYGTVEDYETNISELKNYYQAQIDDLASQIQKLSAYNLTDGEIKVLNQLRLNEEETVRRCTEENAAKISSLETQLTASNSKLESIKNESENFKRRIMTMCGTEK